MPSLRPEGPIAPMYVSERASVRHPRSRGGCGKYSTPPSNTRFVGSGKAQTAALSASAAHGNGSAALRAPAGSLRGGGGGGGGATPSGASNRTSFVSTFEKYSRPVLGSAHLIQASPS